MSADLDSQFLPMFVREPAVKPLAPMPSNEALSRSVYRAGKGPSWLVLLAILGAHGALLAALLAFDVIRIAPKAATTEVTLIPLEIIPPPPLATPSKIKPAKTPPPIVAPPPIVQIAVVNPPPVQVSPKPPPPTPVVPTPASAPVAEPAPVSAPDGTARTLGNPSPKYPISARMAHQEGVVRLRVLITAEGGVKEISVARSSGFDSLDNAALDTVRRWRFLPGLQAGRAVEAVGYLNIPFRLTRA